MRYKEIKIVENNPFDDIVAAAAGGEPFAGSEPRTNRQGSGMRANPDGSISRPNAPQDNAQDNAQDNTQGLEAGPPYPQEDMDAVRDMQTKLEELGYSVGSTGIDGKYGPRTSRAVAAYMRDRNIADADRGRSIAQNQLTALASAEPVESPSPTGNERQRSSGRSFDPSQLAALDFGGADNERAKEIAEEYLGSSISDTEWDMLVRATVAEASDNQIERAAVMGVILNRVRNNYGPRGGFGRSIEAQLYADWQFQAVTGTRYDRNPSENFTSPSRQQVAGVVQAVIDHLPDANRSWMNFTANDLAAYGPGTNPEYRDEVTGSPGSQVIGGTVFGTT